MRLPISADIAGLHDIQAGEDMEFLPMDAVVRRLASKGMQAAAIARKTQLSEDAVAEMLSAQQ